LPESVGSIADRLHGNIIATLKTRDQIMSRASLKSIADTDEIFDVFRPRIQFLAALSEKLPWTPISGRQDHVRHP
jgi:hypothetical protein